MYLSNSLGKKVKIWEHYITLYMCSHNTANEPEWTFATVCIDFWVAKIHSVWRSGSKDRHRQVCWLTGSGAGSSGLCGVAGADASGNIKDRCRSTHAALARSSSAFVSCACSLGLFWLRFTTIMFLIVPTVLQFCYSAKKTLRLNFSHTLQYSAYM